MFQLIPTVLKQNIKAGPWAQYEHGILRRVVSIVRLSTFLNAERRNNIASKDLEAVTYQSFIKRLEFGDTNFNQIKPEIRPMRRKEEIRGRESHWGVIGSLPRDADATDHLHESRVLKPLEACASLGTFLFPGGNRRKGKRKAVSLRNVT